MSTTQVRLNLRSGVTRLCDRPSCNERLDDGEQVARCPMCLVMAELWDQAQRDRYPYPCV